MTQPPPSEPEPREPFNYWSGRDPNQPPPDLPAQQPPVEDSTTPPPPPPAGELPPGSYPGQPQYVVVNRPTSGYATASLVFGIIGVLGGWCMFGIPCVIAVLTGHLALKETKTGQRGGHGMAIAGLIMGYPFAIFWIAWAVIGGGGALFNTLFR